MKVQLNVFTRHYGFGYERNSLRREVKTIANLAEQYVENRFSRLRTEAENKNNDFQGFPRLVVELDGSMIRTGVNYQSDKEEFTPKRKLQKQKRQIDWREVRVGFARRVTNKEQRTFIARFG